MQRVAPQPGMTAALTGIAGVDVAPVEEGGHCRSGKLCRISDTVPSEHPREVIEIALN